MPEQASPSSVPIEGSVVQIKVWLLQLSLMAWRRVLVPSSCTLRELHGIIQVAMSWEGLHLYQFCLRVVRYGSCELSASSPEVTLAALHLRKGAQFTYEYDLNIPWRHEVRVEDYIAAESDKTYPRCTGGGGACPPEDCGGPESYLAALDEAVSLDALADIETMAEIIEQVVRERRLDILDDETRGRLERAMARGKARERAQGRPFSQRAVNARLCQGEHRVLMY